VPPLSCAVQAAFALGGTASNAFFRIITRSCVRRIREAPDSASGQPRALQSVSPDCTPRFCSRRTSRHIGARPPV
jgi:hypothetical protein